MSLVSPRPVAVEFFSGCGGLALGMEQAGFDIAFAVDYDPVHAAAYKFNFPHTPVYCEDMTQAKPGHWFDRLEDGGSRLRGDRVDVVFGGPPCQGFSTAGKRRYDDARNRLVVEFVDAVAELSPRYFFFENVPGLRNAANPDNRGERLLDAVERRLEGRYSVTVTSLNARSLGTPQDRRRLFVVGVEHGLQEVEQLATGTHPYVSVDDALRDLPPLEKYADRLRGDTLWLKQREAAALRSSADEYALGLRAPTAPGSLAAPRPSDERFVTCCLPTLHTGLVAARFDSLTAGERDPISRFLRLDPKGLAPTLRAGTGYERGSFSAPRPIHPSEPRVITVREAMRLSGFPDWFRVNATKWHGFRQVGNAVPPPVARHVGEALVDALAISPANARPSELGDPSLLRMAAREAGAHFGALHESRPQNRMRTRITMAA